MADTEKEMRDALAGIRKKHEGDPPIERVAGSSGVTSEQVAATREKAKRSGLLKGGEEHVDAIAEARRELSASLKRARESGAITGVEKTFTIGLDAKVVDGPSLPKKDPSQIYPMGKLEERLGHDAPLVDYVRGALAEEFEIEPEDVVVRLNDKGELRIILDDEYPTDKVLGIVAQQLAAFEKKFAE